ncbi:MAG: ATP synthase F0 subunit C [Clostridiales bacterium]|nr:ATP synthase F0 subunit C [Clostridiales bacterium]
MNLLSFANAMLDTTSSIDPRAMAALAAGIAIGMGALGAAMAMGKAASHAFDAGARQPEIFSKIQSMLIITIVFIETLCIYALVVALILIFTVK